MARLKGKKMVRVLDQGSFEKARYALVALSNKMGRKQTLTNAMALKFMISTAASFYGVGDRMMVVNWSEAQDHIAQAGQNLADHIIKEQCRAMSEFLGVELSVAREGKAYRLVCRDKFGNVLDHPINQDAAVPARLPS